MSGLVISGIFIDKDKHGRFSLNDIHNASGGMPKKQPSLWLRLGSTKELIESIHNSTDHYFEAVSSSSGRYGGTYATEDLCLAYAEWIYGTQFKVMLFNSLKDVGSIIRAINDFEVPDDLPDLFVYAAREVDTGNIKLGISKNPEQRLKQLQTANSSKLELIAIKEAPNRYKDEEKNHQLNSANHIRGEWFNANAALI